MSQAEPAAGQGRILAFDAYRGIAILCVVFGHSTAFGWKYWHDAEYQFEFWLSVAERNFLLPCLPIFLFLSGYLLGSARVDNWPAYKNYVSRRVSRVAIPYVVWSLFFIALSSVRAGVFSPQEVLFKLATGQADGPFYFILIMLQFYFLTPLFLRILDWKFGMSILMSVHVLYVIFIDTVQLLYWTDMPFAVAKTPFIAWLSIFPMGIYMRRNPQVVEGFLPRYTVPMAIVFLMLSIVESKLLLDKGTFELAISDIRLMPLAYGYAVIFTLLRLVHWPWPQALATLGGMSFGIFFIHGFILRRMEVVPSFLPFLQEHFFLFQVTATLIVLVVCVAVITVARRVLPEYVTSRLLAF